MRYLIDHLREQNHQGRLGEVIKNAVTIDIQNVVDYYSSSPQSVWEVNRDLPCAMPPFDSFAMEYIIPDQVNENGVWRDAVESERGKRLCNIVTTWAETETTKSVMVFTYTDIEGFKGPGIAPFTVLYEVDKKTGEMIPLGSNTEGEQNWYKIFANDDFLREYAKWDLKTKQDCLNFTKPLLLAISFMNCRNVEKVVKRASLFPKSRRREGRPPLVKVYTLEIGPIKKIIGEHSGSSELLTPRALHICRGHFKDFSHGQGLFGKYKGRYWWPMTTRGSKEAGEVIKDYAVKI